MRFGLAAADTALVWAGLDRFIGTRTRVVALFAPVAALCVAFTYSLWVRPSLKLRIVPISLFGAVPERS